MLFADLMVWVFAIAGLLLALPGLWLLCRGLWPGLVERTTADCARGLWLPVLCGIPITVATVLLVSVTNKMPSPWQGIVAIVVISSAILFSSIGIVGLATVIGQRLPSPADADRPWKATIRGAVVLELSFLAFPVGPFLLLPLTLILGAGTALRATIAAIWSRPKRPKVAPTPAPAASDIILDGGTLGAST